MINYINRPRRIFYIDGYGKVFKKNKKCYCVEDQTTKDIIKLAKKLSRKYKIKKVKKDKKINKINKLMDIVK